jgi:hypothetical protein
MTSDLSVFYFALELWIFNHLNNSTFLYPQKLALTSPTSGGRSVGIVRLRTKSRGVFLGVWLFLFLLFRPPFLRFKEAPLEDKLPPTLLNFACSPC